MTATGSLRIARSKAREGPVGSRRGLFSSASVDTSIERSSANSIGSGRRGADGAYVDFGLAAGAARPPTTRAGEPACVRAAGAVRARIPAA